MSSIENNQLPTSGTRKKMSPIKNTISNRFSKNKKMDEGVSSEIENEPGIIEETADETTIKDNSNTEGNEKHDTEFENDTTVQEDLEADPEWEKRVLCSDGNCIGVIGPDGRCKECGKPYDGPEQIYDPDDNEQEIYDSPPDEGLISDEQDFSPEDSDNYNNHFDKSSTETDSESEPESESESEWDKRILCSDGNCIGVIGPDGRCKECGKPYEG
jgi:hypothetical protein